MAAGVGTCNMGSPFPVWSLGGDAGRLDTLFLSLAGELGVGLNGG